jgi:predicted nucleotidyltransferase
MKMKHYDRKKLNRKILNIFSRYINLTDFRIFYFGSRLNEKCDDRADIDIGIEGKNEISFLTLTQIRSDIEELPILYKIDVVDFNKTSPEFKKVALQKIEVIDSDK